MLNPAIGSLEKESLSAANAPASAVMPPPPPLRSGAPCGDFAQCAATKWGKFGDPAFHASSNHSFQVYEPCDQSDIQAAVEAFESAGVFHAPGLRFAIK